ncbi:MAG: T9SS C-terminal target domain-containing protein [Flavobacteriales bacterium]|nr:T9SS C-terminal target domain-containing protein [Flavobacteriales bacterium]
MKGLQRATTRTFALSLAAPLCLLAWAAGPIGNTGSTQQVRSQGAPKAGACSPATQVTQLAYNNVRAVIENGGNLWTRRGGSARSGYEVPKTEDFSGANAIYAGGLWMGGLSSAGQLRLAAVLYRANGNDFWPGPLNRTDASVTPDVCQAYDKFWTTQRAEAETHLQWIRCSEDPECDLTEVFPNGYSVPTSFLQWPAIGDVEAGQDLYIAPFLDYNEDGQYNPYDGDYPDYGFDLTVEDCKNKRREDPVPLFGDFNIWWVFNDKGDAHTETQGQPIGLEVRAQAFAFSSNNEINNMTFYNYTVINWASQTLTNTYFGHFVDADLGCSNDDFTGCDVRRGLGYIYNWDDVDEGCLGAIGYGGPSPPPPAIGVDFFEGPFQDNDGVDNPGPASYLENFDCLTAQAQNGIPYRGIGIGYGDGIPDNERFGMRAFLYFNREAPNANVTDPSVAAHYYNYLRSIWKNGVPMTHGGNGFDASGNGVRTFYMFPGDTDPVGWGTNCVPQGSWSDDDRTFVDRRFVQSAGPFTLEPGAFNNITVGVVYARSPVGGAINSLEPLRVADDKAQALFDNCFKILDGPDAPDLSIRELDRELILYLVNPEGSNNENLGYEELDPIIPLNDGGGGPPYDRYYRFQGYKVYQMKNADASVSDLDNVELARLVYQGDLEDGIGQIVNFPYDPAIQLAVPTEMVNGADAGVRHAIRVTTDKFAQGDPRLVNFKSYYYIAVAYGYNNYAEYDLAEGTGQAFPYVAGRKAAFGSIRSYVGIPHKPGPEAFGTGQNSGFDDAPQVTRLEGQGNGNLELDIEPATENAIMSGFPWRKDELVYKRGLAPINVRIVDPLKVPDARFEVWFQDSITPGDLDDAYWYLKNVTTGQVIPSHRAINIDYEQIFPEFGISVAIGQAYFDGNYTEPIGGAITFDDPSKAWFTGVPDAEGVSAFNWIRSGSFIDDVVTPPTYSDRPGIDDNVTQAYEKILSGTWAPWPLVGGARFQPGATPDGQQANTLAKINETPSVQVVITKDKSKWSRVPVLEQDTGTVSVGGVQKLFPRGQASVDKNGLKPGDPGCNVAEAEFINANGMGWFPGYAIDLETGERLNMAFGENSFWGGSIGRDMVWNPNDQFVLPAPQGEIPNPFFGGGHWIYVFKNDRRQSGQPTRIGPYDDGQGIRDGLASTGAARTTALRAVAWVGSAMLIPGAEFMATDVRIRLNVRKPYQAYTDYNGSPAPITPALNNGLPLYAFGTGEYAVQTNVASVADEFLDKINIVPNPYYAFSGYETSRLDNRVKFINLPPVCTISIFTVNGTLVRKYRKDNTLTYLDWDLKNSNSIPIAGGVYICHIEVPNVGEKVLKWFGVLRPLDLQNF